MKRSRFALATTAAALLVATNTSAPAQRVPCVNVIQIAPGPSDVTVRSDGKGDCDSRGQFAEALRLAVEEAKRTGANHITVISTNEMIANQHEALKSINENCSLGVRILDGCERRLPQKSDYIPIPITSEK